MTALEVGPFITFDNALLWLARRFLFVREIGGANRGIWVEIFQSFTGGQDGDSWCADAVCFILAIMYGGYLNMPIPRTGSCAVIYAHATSEGWIVATPQLGDLYFYVDAYDHAHHIGLVSVLTPLTGIAGNTSPDGTSSNGTGMFEHTLVPPKTGRIAYARYPRPPIVGAPISLAA